MSLDDVITLDEAADIAGRQPVSLRRAAGLGKLEARRIGAGGSTIWITTREALSAYMAYVASAAWSRQPQHRRKRAHRRRRGVRVD